MAVLRVTHIIADLSPEAGGPSYSVPALAAAERRCGAEARVRSVGAQNCDDHAFSLHAAQPGPWGRAFRASPSLAAALDADARAGAVLHNHGLWLAPNLYAARAKRRAANPPVLVCSPRGMLGEAALAISYWKKRAVWLLAQRSALHAADCFHATAPSEFEDIRRAGLGRPVAIIPNGVDLPDLAGAPRAAGSERVVLSLGRVHPKKGLDRLVRAWAAIESEFPDWRLSLVGPAELRHDEELRALARSLGAQRVSIEGAVYGDGRLRRLREADLFVLSTLNENFALTVAEALAAETPVISTKGAPWAGLERERCGWWIDHGPESMAQALRTAMQLPREQRYVMGARGRLWMARDFGWDRIGADMIEVYRWLQTGGEPPPTVRLD